MPRGGRSTRENPQNLRICGLDHNGWVPRRSPGPGSRVVGFRKNVFVSERSLS